MNRWISVKEKLRDLGNQNAPYCWSKNVLCALTDNTIHILSIITSRDWINFEGGYSVTKENVTHWMELPDAPNKDK